LCAALAAHKNVESIYLPGHYASATSAHARKSQQALFQRQCTGSGSMIALVVRPNTRAAAFQVLNHVELAHLAVSLGGTETLMEHPRSMTHSDMSVEDLDACGIVEGMLRISIGLESSSDIIHDLLAALDAIDEMVVEPTDSTSTAMTTTTTNAMMTDKAEEEKKEEDAKESAEEVQGNKKRKL
jgi:methionine-gamma-lyase